MINSEYALEIRNLSKTYANGVKALHNIDLTVAKGDFFALLGANGAGKSTTIGLISTLLTKTQGKIFINGFDLDKDTSKAKACLGVVPQELNLNIFEESEQILILQAGYYGILPSIAKPIAQKFLKQLGLWDKRNTEVRYLSGGMKRRLMIARALMHSPSLLILDEPTAGVDIEIRRSMWEFLSEINNNGTTIILTTHYLEEAEQMCKNIAIIDKGVLIKNTSLKDLLQTLQHQTLIFNTIEQINVLPDLYPFHGMKLDDYTIELKVNNEYSLNEVFEVFSKNGIRISSMRNKTNRLEELFMDLIYTS